MTTASWLSFPHALLRAASRMLQRRTSTSFADVALPRGLVDVNGCAIDEMWSGLRLVIRKELRGHRPFNDESTPDAVKRAEAEEVV